MSNNGSEVLTKVNGYLKDNANTTIAAACKALGLKPHQYYNASSQKRAKKMASPARASSKTPEPSKPRPTHSLPTTRHAGLSLLVISDAQTISALARGFNA